MKKRPLSRRDFLKIAGVSTAVAVPTVLGYGVYRSAEGELPVEGLPYMENVLTSNPDGSVPILLIVNRDTPNPFGVYLGEILRAEGITCFHTAELSKVQVGLLEKYTVVILAETLLTTMQVDMFEAYIAHGGKLVGMKPDDRLGAIFGLERSAGSLSEGYLGNDPDHPVSEGFQSSSLQFHGSANLYRLTGARAIAWLYSDRETPTEHPAIAINKTGSGMSVAFAFDLAKSIVYMRQGNPVFSGQERDGHPFIRASDMFVDWLDLERISIPQADEQQRLFVKIIYELLKDNIPLPRLWYFPGDVDALLIATGDAHPISGAETIDDVLTRVERHGGHMSIYYSFTLHDDFYRFAQRGRFYAGKLPIVGEKLMERFKTPSPDQVSDWRARGHEFTLHPNVGTGICGGYGPDGVIPFDRIEDGWKMYWQQYTGLGYGPVSQTVRTHCVLWKGWTETARLQASYGIRMNFDYYHVGPAFRDGNGDWRYGHFTGSGLPMKFIDEQGRLLNIYQQLTQLADEHFFYFPEITWVSVGDYTAEAALDVSTGLMRSALENGFPAAFGVQFHPDPFAYGGRPADIAGKWLDGMLEYAVEKGIPIWSAQDWLRFTEIRQGIRYTSFTWDKVSGRLELVMEVGLGENEISATDFALMLPTELGDSRLVSIEIDGLPAKLMERKVNNIHYSWTPISTGEHKVVAKFL